MRASALFFAFLTSCPAFTFAASIGQETTTWVEDSFPAAIAFRDTYFKLMERGTSTRYTPEVCPYTGDEDFKASAIPMVSTNPLTYVNYKSGQPEGDLWFGHTVYYSVPCKDGTLGWFQIALRDGVWKFTQAEAPSTGELLAVFKKWHDLIPTRGSTQFGIRILPLSMGGKDFSGAFLIARNLEDRLQVLTVNDVPALNLGINTWMDADAAWLKLQHYELTP